MVQYLPRKQRCIVSGTLMAWSMSSRMKLRPSTDVCADCSAPGKFYLWTVNQACVNKLFVNMDRFRNLMLMDYKVILQSHCWTGPEWASVNRGVLICDECCSVHRSLGRHISQVKHLRHSSWSPTLQAVSKHKHIDVLTNASLSHKLL